MSKDMLALFFLFLMLDNRGRKGGNPLLLTTPPSELVK